MKKVTAYKCSYCKDSSRSIYLSYSGCYQHEKKCWLNPARKSCATCKNLYEAEGETSYEWKCKKRKDVTPFKEKISDCYDWVASGIIFTGIK